MTLLTAAAIYLETVSLFTVNHLVFNLFIAILDTNNMLPCFYRINGPITDCLTLFLCVGNYYGLRGQHENAVVYFRRALRLNPNYLSAWTLMGHSYVELKNAAAAREAYRKAVGKLRISLQKLC